MPLSPAESKNGRNKRSIGRKENAQAMRLRKDFILAQKNQYRYRQVKTSLLFSGRIEGMREAIPGVCKSSGHPS
jgi:hypothetical protein